MYMKIWNKYAEMDIFYVLEITVLSFTTIHAVGAGSLPGKFI